MDEVLGRIGALANETGGEVSVAVRGIENAQDLSFCDDVVMSSASVIKVAIAVEAMRQVKEGRLSLSKEFLVSEECKVRGAGVMRYLHPGTALTLKDLLTLMIVVSDNTATNVVIDLLGMDSVNMALRGMGYTRSALQRKMCDRQMIDKGLDNVCTAGETAGLLARIARREAVGGSYDDEMIYMLRHQQDTDRLGLFLPGEAKLAGKTGSREGIVHDCGIVTGPGFSYAICVLTRGVPRRGDAILAIARVSEAVWEWACGRP